MNTDDNTTNNTTSKPIFENGKYKCPNCNGELNNDELASGRCFNCNEYFDLDFNEISNEKRTKKSIIKNKVIIIFAGFVLLIIILIIYFYCGSNINNKTTETKETTNTEISYPESLSNFYYNLYLLSNEQSNFSMSGIGTVKKESSLYNYWFLVNNFEFRYTNEDSSYSVEFNMSDNKSIRALIPYIIMALDNNIDNETANTYASALIDSFVKYKGSDVVDIGNYIIYLYTDKIAEGYGNFDVVDLNFRPKTDPLSELNLNEFGNLTYEQLLNPMYKGEQVKITLTISSNTIVDTFTNTFEATDSIGNKYRIVYTFDSFPHWFLPSEQYEFYCSVADPSSIPCLRIEGYKKI